MKLAWDLVIALIASIDSFTMPFFSAFIKGETRTYDMFKNMIDFIYVLDIIIEFRTTFYHRKTGEEIFSIRQIAKRYISKGFLIDFAASLSILNHITHSNYLQYFGFLKIVRILRMNRVIANCNFSSETKAMLKIMYILYLLIFYMHFVACILWIIFKIDKVWVPPVYFGDLRFKFMEETEKSTDILNTYFLMVYHATFSFNLVDIAPNSAREILAVTILFIVTAFYNAQIYGEFFVQRSN